MIPSLPAQASVRPLLGCAGGPVPPVTVPLSLVHATTKPQASAAAGPEAADPYDPPEMIWVPPVEPRDRYKAAADFYPYARPPPPGFERWLEYAQPRECLLGRYDRLEADLARFRNPKKPTQRTITRAALARAAALPQTVLFHVRGGRVSFDAAPELETVAREYLVVLDRIGPFLPDTDFVLNMLDTPRVCPRFLFAVGYR